ncbi:MAG: hypothetical protein RI947_908 [Candidatus Parcubacteria bacterium]|jgi:autotransporter family porin
MQKKRSRQLLFTGFILVAAFAAMLSGTRSYYISNAAAVLSGPPPASGKQFTLLPPGSALPTDAECASRVRRTTWEPRPSNSAKNQYVAVKGSDYNVPRYNGSDGGIWLPGHADKANVMVDKLSGNFKGTTDEILQWAACKWGLDEDMARAQAVVESNWDMSANGDNGESFGILQVRNTAHASAFPGAQKSTAFNADYTYMRWRICFEGVLDYLSQTGPYVAGDAWGCMGTWYTGNWYGAGGGGSAGGALEYINAVKAQLNARTWESWGGTQVTSVPVTNSPSASPTTRPNTIISPTIPQQGCAKKNKGDANCDNLVDISDFEIFRREFMGEVPTKNANFDTDATVTIADFETWRRGYFAIQ